MRRKDKKLSISEASSQYGVPYATLHRASQVTDKQPVAKMGGQTVLSEDEESMIVDGLIVCSEWGFPLTRNDIRNVVQDYLNRLVSIYKFSYFHFPPK